MGGQNHQPCRNWLPESTRLSRAVSAARSHLELANVALEDKILAEHGGRDASCDPIVEHLEMSSGNLGQVMSRATELDVAMRTRGFEELASTHNIDWSVVGAGMVIKGIVDRESFDRILGIRLNRGFGAVLSDLGEQAHELARRTTVLRNGVAILAQSKGSFMDALEENRDGNIKVAFARLYSAWHRFGQDFLASAMLSTEAWYQDQGYGSLVVPSEAIQAA